MNKTLPENFGLTRILLEQFVDGRLSALTGCIGHCKNCAMSAECAILCAVYDLLKEKSNAL